MTSVQPQLLGAEPAETLKHPPHTRAIRVTAGVSLLLAGILNGLPQYLTHLLHGDLMFPDYVRWGAAHPGVVQAEQLALVASMLFAPLGLLGVAQVCRWRTPVLTAVGIALTIWGMWGFQNSLALGYIVAYAAPQALGVDQALTLLESLSAEPGAIFAFLVPHLVGSFLGLILLSVACWRSRAFPRTPLLLLIVALVWDFGLAPVGPLEPHLLLVAAWGWMGIHLIRMPHDIWRGQRVVRDAS